MRFTAPLDELIHGRVAVRVLRMLCLFPTKEFTGRELAREADVPPSNVGNELRRLREHGLVQRRTAGRAHLWKLVPGHALVPELRGLFDAELRLREQLRAEIVAGLRGVPGIERAILFGSVTRGDERPTSDVDLLIITRDERSKSALAEHLGDLRQSVQRRFGNRLQIIPYTLKEWRSRKGPGLVDAITREGQVIMEGSL